jgi:hypothetical protein
MSYNIKSTATIHAPISYVPSSIFGFIDRATWLLANDNSLNTVEIVLEPLVGFPTIREAFRMFTNKPAIYSLRELNRIIWGDKKKNIKNSLPRNETLMHSILSGNLVILHFDHGEIRIRRGDNPASISIINSIRNWYKAKSVYKNLIKYNKAGSFLEYTYKGVTIGDKIASTALRVYPDAGGRLLACKGLKNVTYHALEVCDFIDKMIEVHPNTYVAVTETWYLDGIYERLLHSMGAHVLRSSHYSGNIHLTKSTDELKHPWIPPNSQNKSITHKSDIEAYMKNRIYEPKEELSYMTFGVNEEHERVVDENNNDIKLDQFGITAVVYLHSFDDSQYRFGYDGYDDLLMWTEETIKTLISNPNVKNVLVKAHPNVDYKRYPGDYRAYKYLRGKFQDEVTWLKNNVSVLSLKKIDNVVGITHHGSVSEELAYLQIPVIMSSYSRLGCNYKFAFTWENRTEYEEYLKKLTIDELNKLDIRYEDLYSYLESVHMSSRIGNIKKTRQIREKIFHLSSVNQREELNKIKVDDERLSEYINSIYALYAPSA